MSPTSVVEMGLWHSLNRIWQQYWLHADTIHEMMKHVIPFIYQKMERLVKDLRKMGWSPEQWRNWYAQRKQKDFDWGREQYPIDLKVRSIFAVNSMLRDFTGQVDEYAKNVMRVMTGEATIADLLAEEHRDYQAAIQSKSIEKQIEKTGGASLRRSRTRPWIVTLEKDAASGTSVQSKSIEKQIEKAGGTSLRRSRTRPWIVTLEDVSSGGASWESRIVPGDVRRWQKAVKWV